MLARILCILLLLPLASAQSIAWDLDVAQPIPVSQAAQSNTQLQATLPCTILPLQTAPTALDWVIQAPPELIVEIQDVKLHEPPPITGRPIDLEQTCIKMDATLAILQSTRMLPGTHTIELQPLLPTRNALLPTILLEIEIQPYPRYALAVDADGQPLAINLGNVPLQMTAWQDQTAQRFELPVGATQNLLLVGLTPKEGPIYLKDEASQEEAKVLEWSPPTPRVNVFPGFVASIALVGALAFALYSNMRNRKTKR